jgi:DNA ligase-1
MLGKTFKGMTDAVLEWQTRELVVEVAFNEVQRSPQHPAGAALRFARIKGYRADKSAAEADTIASVQRLA